MYAYIEQMEEMKKSNIKKKNESSKEKRKENNR